MMESYVSSGDMAPLICFYNGPAHWTFSNLMASYYGTGYTPSFFCDGVWDRIGWSQSASQSAINSRLTVPAHVSIDVTTGGDETSGVVYYNITAEEDLQAGGMIRLISVLVENDVYASSGWGYYNGHTLDYIPRMSPIGVIGVLLDFTGPYPQTLTVLGDYTIESGWDYDNMGIVTYVFDYSNKEIFNASYEPDLGAILGIESAESALAMAVGPNPSAGSFSAVCSIPDGCSGIVDVFDVTGRLVRSASASSADFNISEAGLYFVRLTASDGETITRSIAVTR